MVIPFIDVHRTYVKFFYRGTNYPTKRLSIFDFEWFAYNEWTKETLNNATNIRIYQNTFAFLRGLKKQK